LVGEVSEIGRHDVELIALHWVRLPAWAVFQRPVDVRGP
jgi:hypothetical protein